MKTSLALIIAVSLTGASALAQQAPAASSNTTSAKTSDVQKQEEQRSNLDQEITNARLRAEAGSKSKYSVKANLSYYGGSVETPFAKERPNYRAAATTDAKSYLTGTVGVAYRATDRITTRVGTGLIAITPFHTKSSELGNNKFEDSNSKVLTVSNPYLEVSSAFRTGNYMHNPGITLTGYTKQSDVELYKKNFDITVEHTTVAEIEGSNWQPGVTVAAYNTFYKDGKQAYDMRGDDDGRDDYGAGIAPFIEYAFNDRYSFRTLAGFYFTHFRNEEAGTFSKDKVYQSMGIGIAATKEIYLYPNVQFLPDDIRSDRTNVGLSTTLNVF